MSKIACCTSVVIHTSVCLRFSQMVLYIKFANVFNDWCVCTKRTLSEVIYALRISYLLIATICTAITCPLESVLLLHAGTHAQQGVQRKAARLMYLAQFIRVTKLTKQNTYYDPTQLLLCGSAASFSPRPAPSTSAPHDHARTLGMWISVGARFCN